MLEILTTSVTRNTMSNSRLASVIGTSSEAYVATFNTFKKSEEFLRPHNLPFKIVEYGYNRVKCWRHRLS